MDIIGKRVAVVWSNPDYDSTIPFPSVGSVGTIVSGIDHDGDFDVEFDNQPCPVGPDTSWCTNKLMVVFWEETHNYQRNVTNEKVH